MKQFKFYDSHMIDHKFANFCIMCFALQPIIWVEAAADLECSEEK